MAPYVVTIDGIRPEAPTDVLAAFLRDRLTDAVVAASGPIATVVVEAESSEDARAAVEAAVYSDAPAELRRRFQTQSGALRISVSNASPA
jgi:hypothetical protein